MPSHLREDGEVTSPVRPVFDPLSVAALDAERHVAAAGWDQPPRLFALVRTADLLQREPQLRVGLGPGDLAPGALTAIEQEGLHQSTGLESVLGRIAWPPDVDGCAFVVERVVVPPDAERDLPSDPEAAVDALAGHPDRKDVRLLAAVLRDGTSVCLLRQREHDSDDAVATGRDLAPGLVAALRATFED
ncbi:PPA1309 family protein [Lapillicoccus sp.]|uniref:PPA1309 family protein n=1 Tax=Lapillicoccus sp. TaxID=1909287 RepID=UPI003263E395